MFELQVLKDPLGVQPLLELGLDRLAIRITLAGRLGHRSARRPRLHLGIPLGPRAGGRGGPFCLLDDLVPQLLGGQMVPNRLSIDVQGRGDLPLGLALLVQFLDGVGLAHA